LTNLLWSPDRGRTAAVAQFIYLALTVDIPPGWLTQPGHLHHAVDSAVKPV
jgi:hypothetical protein